MAVVVTVWIAIPASAAADQPITLLGPDTRSVELTPTASGRLVGELHLALRNTTDKKRLVRLLYFRRQDGLVVTVPGKSDVATVAAGPGTVNKDGTAIRLARDSVGKVELLFGLAAGESPSSLDGTLAVEGRTSSAEAFVHELTLSVAGAIRPLGDVRFESSPLVVQAVRNCPFVDDCMSASKEDVQLVGADVGELVETLKAAGQDSIVTELRRDDGSTVDAKLSSLALVPGEAGIATADVTVARSGPGKYTGSLPLSRLVAESPALEVEFRSRLHWLWCLFFIILGVGTAAVFTQQLGLSRRRKLIRGALEREAAEYCTDRTLNFPEGEDRPLVWDPNVDCPLKDDANWSYYDELKTFTAVYSAAKWARNDTDLDEAESGGMALIAGLTAWRLMLAEVRALWDVAHQPRKDPNDWKATQVSRDTSLLLYRVTRAPLDGTADAVLLGKLRQQTQWHRRYAEAWDLRASLIQAGGDQASEAEKVDLRGLDTKAGPLATRDENVQDERDLELMELLAQLKGSQAESNSDPAVKDVPDPEIPEEAVLRAVAIRRELESLGDVTANPAQSRSALGVHLALQPQDEDADADAAAATPDEAPPAERAVAASPAAAAEEPGAARRLLRNLRRRDLLLSSVVVALSSIVYSATTYDATWGALVDCATAFGAAFTGEVVIKWALLPIYRSVRLRATPAQQ